MQAIVWTHTYVKHINHINPYWNSDIWVVISGHDLWHTGGQKFLYAILLITWHDFNDVKIFLKSDSERSDHSLFRSKTTGFSDTSKDWMRNEKIENP